jgi:hypothetical protein
MRIIHKSLMNLPFEGDKYLNPWMLEEAKKVLKRVMTLLTWS